MNILITNDDGIHDPGLVALYESVKDLGEVTIVAPDNEKSATSHSISLHDPIKLNEVQLNGIKAYTCSGTPVDCVKIALNEVMDKKPDLLLSGINKGSNTGQNIIYSGTVSAAVEGSFYGIPSMAFSITSFIPTEYKSAIQVVQNIVNKMIHIKLDFNTIINVNIPPISYNNIKGIKITRQGKSKFIDAFHENKPNNSFRLDGELKVIRDEDYNDDHCVDDGWVSLTPLQFKLTHNENYIFLKNIESSFNN
ncbi:MAG: 5'/3'-nucleotidase SurE [Candidatus Marinimicrobia bacterium]|nr:5'/3'-nucleotidase SurE [Candidatus Neomarinimicrobiota bacterium]